MSDRIELDEQIEYCSDCLNVFPRAELDSCFSCSLFGRSQSERTIVTQSGVKKIQDKGLHCSGCLKFKHNHTGEVFI